MKESYHSLDYCLRHEKQSAVLLPHAAQPPGSEGRSKRNLFRRFRQADTVAAGRSCRWTRRKYKTSRTSRLENRSRTQGLNRVRKSVSGLSPHMYTLVRMQQFNEVEQALTRVSLDSSPPTVRSSSDSTGDRLGYMPRSFAASRLASPRHAVPNRSGLTRRSVGDYSAHSQRFSVK
jgi:hypothetical protein